MSDAVRRLAERLTRDLADQGKLIEAGWQGYRLLCLQIPPHQAAEAQHEAFVAGAEHLFSSLIAMLDADSGPTPADMQRMRLINEELLPIKQHLLLKYGRTAGSA